MRSLILVLVLSFAHESFAKVISIDRSSITREIENGEIHIDVPLSENRIARVMFKDKEMHRELTKERLKVDLDELRFARFVRKDGKLGTSTDLNLMKAAEKAKSSGCGGSLARGYSTQEHDFQTMALNPRSYFVVDIVQPVISASQFGGLSSNSESASQSEGAIDISFTGDETVCGGFMYLESNCSGTCILTQVWKDSTGLVTQACYGSAPCVFNGHGHGFIGGDCQCGTWVPSGECWTPETITVIPSKLHQP